MNTTTQDDSDVSVRRAHEHYLSDYLSVLLYRKRLVLAVFVIVAAFGTIRTLLQRPIYMATAQILIEKTNPQVLNFQGVTEERPGGYTGIDDYYQTQYKLLQSRTLARQVVESLDLLSDPEFGGPRTKEEKDAILAAPAGQAPEMEGAIDGLLGRLSVQPIRNSRLVFVSIVSSRPDFAARAANAIANGYIAQSLEQRFRTSTEAGTWLAGQIDEQRKRVEDAERRGESIKEEMGIVNIEERRTLLDQRLKELGSTLNARRAERLQKEALWRQMTSVPNPEDLPEVVRDPVVQLQRVELANLERERAQLAERYLAQHPQVLRVGAQIANTRAKILSETQRVIRAAENDYKSAAAQEASIVNALEAAKLEALDLGNRAVRYDVQRRDVAAARQVLDSLVARAGQTDVAAELKSTNIRIVDMAAVPRSPIRPRRARDVKMSLLLGALLAVGAAFFVDYLDNTVKHPDDVRDRLDTALLGVIPETPGGKAGSSPTISNHRVSPRFVESYRVLRTALDYSWNESGPRVMAITSSIVGEGKTVTAVNLALTMAAREGRVLLIDADLRRGRTHTLLRSASKPGLSDVLVGKAALAPTIQHNVAGTTLSHLTRGAHVPNPGDILTDRGVGALLQELRSQYDWIVIDTPPVAVVADALVLASLSDGVIVVVGAEMVPRRTVANTIERVGDAGGRVLGAVLSRAPVERHWYNYRHYVYDSRYYQDHSHPSAEHDAGDEASPEGRGASVVRPHRRPHA